MTTRFNKTAMDPSSEPPIERAMGRVGLANLGNTCFLNTIIQSLRYCTDLTTYLTSNAYKQHIKADRPSAALFEEIVDVTKGMWRNDVRSNASMSPRGFMAQAVKVSRSMPQYEDLLRGGHEDAGEFLIFMVEVMHMAISRRVDMNIVGQPRSRGDEIHIKALEAWANFYKTEYSPIVDNFFGQTCLTMTCMKCGHTNSRFEPWSQIKIPVPSDDNATIDITECLNETFAKEKLDDYRCDGCKEKGNTVIVPTISRLPPYLIVILKRFDNTSKKKRCKVNIDLNTTSLGKWIAFPGVVRGVSPVYSTFAVVEHHGVSRGGHYISHAKHNDSWICYDDTSNSMETPERIINNDTYILLMTNKPYNTPVPVTKEIKPE